MESKPETHICTERGGSQLEGSTHPKAPGEVFNVGCGDKISLNQLLAMLNKIVGVKISPAYEPGRKGDVKHSLADISKGKAVVGLLPCRHHVGRPGKNPGMVPAIIRKQRLN